MEIREKEERVILKLDRGPQANGNPCKAVNVGDLNSPVNLVSTASINTMLHKRENAREQYAVIGW
jgi:hypothetical protein